MEFSEWSDENIFFGDQSDSLFLEIRKTLVAFLEHKRIARFILFMVILLCVVIFTELSLAQ